MIQEGHMARMEQKMKPYTILAGKPEGNPALKTYRETGRNNFSESHRNKI